MQQAGLNPSLLERADIREGIAWVHRDLPEQATAKAKAAVEMAVTKSTFQYPISNVQSSISNRGLVIGGGLAGMTAALELAEMGFGVDLVEKGDELGGNLRTAHYTLEGGKPQELLASLMRAELRPTSWSRCIATPSCGNSEEPRGTSLLRWLCPTTATRC